MKRPKDKPATQSWLIRTSLGESSVSSYPELIALNREGKLGDGFFYHPVAKFWVRTQAVEHLKVCRTCGYIGSSIDQSQLNGCLAVVLLLLLVVPGIIYIVWGMTTPGKKLCKKCGAVNTMIPVTSPLAFSSEPSQPPSSFCSACGKYHQGKVVFCPHCGTKI